VLLRGFPEARRASRGYVRLMWDILTWHDGTLAVAWWAVLVVVFLALIAGGSHAAKR
jgi:hypothetical protein